MSVRGMGGLGNLQISACKIDRLFAYGRHRSPYLYALLHKQPLIHGLLKHLSGDHAGKAPCYDRTD